ncbi:MAG: M48 family metalloprotease, partial [Pseudomonadota bacterium]
MATRRPIRAALLSLALLLLLPGIAQAQGLIRDAELERTMDMLMRPILGAAGVPANTIELYLLNRRDLNAFVAGGRRVFVHSGLIMELDEADQLQAVLAHELGHITGGHIARREGAARVGQGAAILGLIVGAAAALAGSGDAAAAAAFGGSRLGQRSFFAHTRAEEAGADQAAVTYMERAGIDPYAMLEVLSLFEGQQALSTARVDPYVLTHPLSSERIQLLEDRSAISPARGAEVAPDTAYWYARMQAKFAGFLDHPSRTFRRYPESDTSEPAMMARAIAWARQPDIARSRVALDELIARRPNDAYYHELKGELMLRNARGEEAIRAYRRAVALAPEEPLILAGLGRALVAANTPAADAEAL